MHYAPTLETARLTLRRHALTDVDACVAMWGDPLVTRHIGGTPANPEEVWARVLRYAGLWSLLGFGYWIVEERETRRFVGEVGLADFHRDIIPSFDGAAEVGWALAPWAHGNGYATEAVRAALAWGDRNLAGAYRDAGRVVCMIGAANVASIRVAERCGFSSAGVAEYKGGEAGIYSRPFGG